MIRGSVITSDGSTPPMIAPVMTARFSGLAYTASKCTSPIFSRIARACASPVSFKGSSVSPCISRALFKFVCPCRVR